MKNRIRIHVQKLQSIHYKKQVRKGGIDVYRKCENEIKKYVYSLTNEVCEYQYLRTMLGPPAAMTSSATWSESFTTSDT